jgi:phosphoglycolate phosphatase
LVLWNIDLTLLDVARVTRAAYADAFREVTGRQLVQLPQMAGRIESEIFFEALALNVVNSPADEELLARFSHVLAVTFAARRDQLTEQGQVLPGAAEAVAGVASLPGVVQSLLTGTIKPNAIVKLRAFGLDSFFDVEIGGYGSQVYPKGAQLLMIRARAAEKFGAQFDERSTVYIADSTRDIDAARAGGARCVAVASGRSTVSELRAAGADVVFGDLADTDAVTAAVDRLTLAAVG